MKAKTIRGTCPRCCPDGGAIFEILFSFDYDTEKSIRIKKCNNCHIEIPIKKMPKRDKPNEEQTRMAAKILESFGGEQESHMIGRNLWISGKNYARGCINGESYFGTIGPRGKLDITFQQFRSDVKITDDIGVEVYLNSDFLRKKGN